MDKPKHLLTSKRPVPEAGTGAAQKAQEHAAEV